MRFDALVKEVLYGCEYGNTACSSKRWPCVDRGYGVSGSKPSVVSICVGGREGTFGYPEGYVRVSMIQGAWGEVVRT